MKFVRGAAIALVSILIIIQFIRPERTAGPDTSGMHIGSAYPVPESVGSILSKACNDCHSYNTRYPWYSEIQPVGWWIQDHIEDGRRHLNFDQFIAYPLARQYTKLQEVETEVREAGMPLESYLPMHPEARLTDEERETLVRWTQAIRDTMRSLYPMDSLQRRREQAPSDTNQSENGQ